MTQVKKTENQRKFGIMALICQILCIFAFILGYIDINWGLVLGLIDIFAISCTFTITVVFLVKRKWPLALCLSLIFITSIVITILLARTSPDFEILLERSSNTLKHFRFFIFIGLFGFIWVQIILGTIWKPARNWGVLAFFVILTAILTIVGQVIDYVTRQDDATYFRDASGRSYTDYGLSDSSFDRQNAYYSEKNKGELT